MLRDTDVFQLLFRIFNISSVAVEKNQSYDVDDESGHTYIDHAVDSFNHVRVGQALDCLDEDCEAQSDQEHRVDESTEHFSACPAVRVLPREFLGHLRAQQQHLSSS